MQNDNELTSQEKTVQGRQAMQKRDERRAELRTEIRELEKQRDQVKMSMAESVFESRFRSQIEALRTEFVDELRNQANGGMTPKFNLASPGAQAYFFGDAILNELPRLAEKVTGRKNASSTNDLSLQIIADELILLHSEYAGLGGTLIRRE